MRQRKDPREKESWAKDVEGERPGEGLGGGVMGKRNKS